MHKTESVLENETHKILKDFGIHTDHLIPTRRSDLMLINNVDYLARELKTAMEYEGDGGTNCS